MGSVVTFEAQAGNPIIRTACKYRLSKSAAGVIAFEDCETFPLWAHTVTSPKVSDSNERTDAERNREE